MLRLSNNIDLPELPMWQARSFWAQILLTLAVVLNTMGVDLWAVLREMGLGGSPQQVIATGERAVAAWQQLAPLVLGLWAWLERRAPRYRLVWRGWSPSIDIVGALFLAIAVLASAGAVQAGACAPRAALTELLADRYGERSHGMGVIGAPGPAVQLFVNPDTGSWTLLELQPGGMACIAAIGTTEQPRPEGEPA
jgi:hypothetical protein